MLCGSGIKKNFAPCCAVVAQVFGKFADGLVGGLLLLVFFCGQGVMEI